MHNFFIDFLIELDNFKFCNFERIQVWNSIDSYKRLIESGCDLSTSTSDVLRAIIIWYSLVLTFNFWGTLISNN